MIIQRSPESEFKLLSLTRLTCMTRALAHYRATKDAHQVHEDAIRLIGAAAGGFSYHNWSNGAGWHLVRGAAHLSSPQQQKHIRQQQQPQQQQQQLQHQQYHHHHHQNRSMAPQHQQSPSPPREPRRRPYRQQRPHQGGSSSSMLLGVLAVFAVGCACMSWRLGHHTQVREELEGTWLRSLVGGGTGSASLPEERVIVHFSTDCTSFQHWQALTLLDSAIRVGQRGAIVRMVSGCDKGASLTGEEQLTEGQVRADHERFLRGEDVPFSFHLLFIDDMSTLSGSGARYKFANKGQSLHYWIDELGGGTLKDVVGDDVPGAEEDHDVAVVSIDPDFLFLTPFGPRELGLVPDDGSHNTPAALQSSRALLHQGLLHQPVAQAYGLGYGWLKFNRTAICGADSPCVHVDEAAADRHYNVGPPYALHRDDWPRFLDAWIAFIPQVYDQYPYVDGPNKDPTRHYAEMFAWAMAAAHLRLPHRLLPNAMLGCMVPYSRTLMLEVGRQDFPSPLRCGVDSVVGKSPSLPAFLHFCQHHVLRVRAADHQEEWPFFKRMVPHDLISDCGPHFLALPPPASFSFGSEDAFVTCTMTEAINASKRRYRRAACPLNATTAGGGAALEQFDVRLVPGGGSRRIGRGEIEAPPIAEKKR